MPETNLSDKQIDALGNTLHEAWQKYFNLFGVPPHGTLQQLKTLIAIHGEGFAVVVAGFKSSRLTPAIPAVTPPSDPTPVPPLPRLPTSIAAALALAELKIRRAPDEPSVQQQQILELSRALVELNRQAKLRRRPPTAVCQLCDSPTCNGGCLH